MLDVRMDKSIQAGTVEARTGPILATEPRAYLARNGHGSSVIDFSCARFTAHEVLPDKALRQERR
jgi:hypothetical protein